LSLPAPLLVITDRKAAARPLEEVVAGALRGGCRWLSLREKDLAHEERVALLERIVSLGRPFDATITVHGDIDAALATGADGVHLPAGGSPEQARARLGKGALIGLSVHSAREARAAAPAADYVTLSPIFGSISKPGYGPALGVQGLADAVASARVPIVALGGITADTLAPCFAAGAAAVAAMGAVMAAADLEAATAALLQARDETGSRRCCFLTAGRRAYTDRRGIGTSLLRRSRGRE
jgi:thiamine-phosphate pyrophosphorylase